MIRRLTTTRRKFVVKRSSIHGRGLFAAVPFERGTYLGSYKGPRTRRDGPYVLWLHDDDDAVGIDGKNELRYVNHSSRPNAIFRGEELFALRGIRPGEEITFEGEKYRLVPAGDLLAKVVETDAIPD